MRVNPIIIDERTGRRLLRASDCAELVGVRISTWSSYSSRGQCPRPVGYLGSQPVWDAQHVEQWALERGSRG